MLQDGTYAAWFKTPVRQGAGIVRLADGKIWGRDSLMIYSGTCRVDGDRFTAMYQPTDTPTRTKMSRSSASSMTSR